MSRLYQPLAFHQDLPKPDHARKFNHVHGFDAELVAGAYLVTAAGGEISWGSRQEDGRKIDLFLSYAHPWYNQEPLTILIQVKLGPSYAATNADGFLLYAATKGEVRRKTTPVCLIWIEREHTSAFWAYLHQGTPKGDQPFGTHHAFSPALRYDLARCQAQTTHAPRGGIGISLRSRGDTVKQKRQLAKAAYVALKDQKLLSPVLGEVNISRVGWRHMFRSGRNEVYKDSSLTIIHYLSQLLRLHPSTLYSLKPFFKEKEGYIMRCMEYVLSYDRCQLSTMPEKKIKVIIRLLEEVTYPQDWRNGMLSHRVKQTVTLVSCYYKEPIKRKKGSPKKGSSMHIVPSVPRG